MTKFSKKRFAFTMVELMIILSIMGIILTASTKIYKAKTDYMQTSMYYSAFSALKQAFGELVSQGCTATDVTNGICYDRNNVPAVGHDLINNRGLCDRLSGILNITSSSCSTSTAVTEASNFNTETPNLVLSNGMRIFNIGRTGAFETFSVYVDIDGLKGDGKYQKDVFLFVGYYDGTILPSGTAADNSKNMKANVFTINASGVETELLHGVSYAKAFCSSLSDTKIAQTDPDMNGYCTDYAYTNSVACKANGCNLQIIKPGY